MNQVYHIFLLAYLLFPLLIQGQDTVPPLRRFYTQQMQARVEKTEAVLEARSATERLTEESRRTKVMQKLTVPVVFHILYSPGQEIPNGEQIAAQLAALNRDFSAADAAKYQSESDYQTATAVDTEISFCVPAKNPAGKKTNGVNLAATNVTAWTATDEMKSDLTNGASPWDPRYYVNIWVVHLVDSISGWAQMPGGPAGSDGIVIDYRYFGTGGTAMAPYDQGKTLTHLMGNYLNLYDLWNENSMCGDDYVGDTPIHNGPNYHCYPNEMHVSLCEENPVEMTMNFMDATPDDCMYMFTAGQKQRMQAVLLEGGPRSGLVEQEVKCGRPSLKAFSSNNAAMDIISTKTDTTKSTPATVLATEIFPTVSINVFPNPASTVSNLVLTSSCHTDASITVYDVLGKTVWHRKIEATQGEQRFDLPVNDWLAGSYYVQVNIGSDLLVERLVVQPHINGTTPK